MLSSVSIFNESCIDGMKRLQDESIDLVVTDPPYKIVSRGTVGKNAKRKVGGILKRNDGKVFADNDIKFNEWLPEVYRLLKQGSHCYIFTNFMNLEELMKEGRAVGFEIHNLLVWIKNNSTPNQYYMKNCEYVVLFRKGKAKWINNMGSKTAHAFDNVNKGKIHPTQKPYELLEMYVKNSSEEGNTVLDPFSGSCSTGKACMNTNRHFIGFEKDLDFYSSSIENLHDYKLQKLYALTNSELLEMLSNEHCRRYTNIELDFDDIVPILRKDNVSIIARPYPFDDDYSIMSEQKMLYQVEFNYEIEDHTDFRTALSVYETEIQTKEI